MPQFENTLKDLKAKLPSEQYNRQINNISDSIYDTTILCSEPTLRSNIPDLCNGLVSFVVVICKGEMIKREIFECINTHSIIDAYLKGYQITDAET
ncbi:MAG TPA: hypothetical protein VJ250_01065 [Nitrososphaeraceae archaeon]|nr:hypothetical protein [Nitrososphaeraceae archaeon]